MATTGEFGQIATLLRYPNETYAADVTRSSASIAAVDPKLAALLGEFVERTRGISVEEMQVLYTSTFDLDPICSLEVGWHLFGENYERGEFLVKMRGELRRLGVAESSELPDHLSHVLEALDRMQADEASDFAAACLFPALDKIIAGFKDKANPFEFVLLAARQLLELR